MGPGNAGGDLYRTQVYRNPAGRALPGPAGPRARPTRRTATERNQHYGGYTEPYLTSNGSIPRGALDLPPAPRPALPPPPPLRRPPRRGLRPHRLLRRGRPPLRFLTGCRLTRENKPFPARNSPQRRDSSRVRHGCQIPVGLVRGPDASQAGQIGEITETCGESAPVFARHGGCKHPKRLRRYSPPEALLLSLPQRSRISAARQLMAPRERGSVTSSPLLLRLALQAPALRFVFPSGFPFGFLLRLTSAFPSLPGLPS